MQTHPDVLGRGCLPYPTLMVDDGYNFCHVSLDLGQQRSNKSAKKRKFSTHENQHDTRIDFKRWGNFALAK
jgi:hypothetical protein